MSFKCHSRKTFKSILIFHEPLINLCNIHFYISFQYLAWMNEPANNLLPTNNQLKTSFNGELVSKEKKSWKLVAIKISCKQLLNLFKLYTFSLVFLLGIVITIPIFSWTTIIMILFLKSRNKVNSHLFYFCLNNIISTIDIYFLTRNIFTLYNFSISKINCYL